MIRYSDHFVLFDDDIRVFSEIKPAHESLLLQRNINCVHGQFISNFIKLKVNSTSVLSVPIITSLLSFDYKLRESPNMHSKLNFYHHVDYTLSQTIKRLLRLIQTLTFPLYSAYWCCIALCLVLSQNMPLLCGILSLLLMPVIMSASLLVIFSIIYSTNTLIS